MLQSVENVVKTFKVQKLVKNIFLKNIKTIVITKKLNKAYAANHLLPEKILTYIQQSIMLIEIFHVIFVIT